MKETTVAIVTTIRTWIAAQCLPVLPAIAASIFIAVIAAPAQAQTVTYRFDLPAQPLADALRAIGRQTSKNILFDPALVEGISAPALRAELTLSQAVSQLLAGTKLSTENVPPDTVLIKSEDAASSKRNASTSLSVQEGQAFPSRSRGKGLGGTNGNTVVLKRAEAHTGTANSDEPRSTPEAEEITVTANMPEILVRGSRTLNMDIRRSEDDAQPYVIFDRAIIEKSGVANLETFLQQRLPMSTSAVSINNSGTFGGAGQSQINLRGLGASQTLILIDGRRTASTFNFGSGPGQPDISGIPLASIERIEVLPTTASGIYGGSATGGVINIVLRRDYSGLESRLTYDNTFDTDTATVSADLSAGFALEGGKTRLMLAGSFTDGGELLIRDRDLVQRGIARVLQNNPGVYLNSPNPPLGATTNIRSATLVNGVPQDLTLKDGTPLNSPVTHVPVGYGGAASDQGAALVANAGTYNFNLANSIPRSIHNFGGLHRLYGGNNIETLSATMRRQFTPRVQAFLELAGSNSTLRTPNGNTTSLFTIPATSPTNPFNQAIRVTVPNASGQEDTVLRNGRRAAAGGVMLQLPGEWLSELDYAWTRTRTASSQPPETTVELITDVQNGELDVLRDTDAFPLDYSPYIGPRSGTFDPQLVTMQDVTLRLSGPVLTLPTGKLTLSSLIEYREEDIGETNVQASGFTVFAPSQRQSVSSAYLEARLPLVKINQIAGLQELELQVAGRHDRYTTSAAEVVAVPTPETIFKRARNEVSSTDPTIGLRYKPVRDLMLRTSYGTGFLPPNVSQLIPFPAVLTGTFADPRRAGEVTGTITVVQGGNPNLQPEASESWSAGAVFTPRFIPGMRLSIDYTRIHKSDNIASINILANESLFPDRVLRNPDPATFGTFGVGPITLVDLSRVNVARAKVEAYDAQLDYSWDIARAGRFELFAVATQQSHLQTQVLPTEPFVENVGMGVQLMGTNPLKLKGNAGLTWSRSAWTLGWTSRYFHSYLAANPSLIANVATLQAQGNGGRVPSQHYHDVVASYRFSPDADFQWLADSEIQLGVRNVFNTKPPVDVGNGSLRYSSFGDPRLASYYVTFRKNFGR